MLEHLQLALGSVDPADAGARHSQGQVVEVIATATSRLQDALWLESKDRLVKNLVVSVQRKSLGEDDAAIADFPLAIGQAKRVGCLDLLELCGVLEVIAAPVEVIALELAWRARSETASGLGPRLPRPAGQIPLRLR